MHPSVVRQIHAHRIFHAVRLHPHLTQREIAEKSGADKSTVSAIVREFEASGLILRSRREAGNGVARGRPAERIAISAEGGVLVGIHPRPSEVRFVAAGLDGRPTGTLSRPPPAGAEGLPTIVVEGLGALLREVGRSRSEVRAVGVSITGLVGDNGRLAQSPNLGWRDVPLHDLLCDVVQRALFIGNNAHSATIAERMFGHGTKVDDFLYLESGSGVGGGLVLDGSLYHGSRGYAGEIGHTKVVPNGRPCRCGGRGCLSAYVAGHSLLRQLDERGVPVASMEELVQRAEADDPAVRALLEEAGGHLGLAVANLVNLFNPPLIVLGGGFARLSRHLMPALRRVLDATALPSALGACELRISTVSLEAIPRGAIALALEGCTSLAAGEHAPW